MDCHTEQLCYPLPSISVVLSSPVSAPFSRGKATVISSQSLCLSFPVGRRSLLAVGRWVREKSPAGRKRENAHFVKRRTHHH